MHYTYYFYLEASCLKLIIYELMQKIENKIIKYTIQNLREITKQNTKSQ